MSQQGKLHDIFQSCTVQLPHILDSLVAALHHVRVHRGTRAAILSQFTLIKAADLASPAGLSLVLSLNIPGLMNFILKLVTVNQDCLFSRKREHLLRILLQHSV